jgi:hypothetical protein
VANPLAYYTKATESIMSAKKFSEQETDKKNFSGFDSLSQFVEIFFLLLTVDYRILSVMLHIQL